jgi:hypothetical protein
MTAPFARASLPLLIGTVLATAVFARAAAAQNYDVQVTQELNGLDIKIEPVANAGMLVVNLTNDSAQKVKCDVKFQADPQVPSRSFVFIEPGKRSSATLRAKQKWFEVDVDVRCKPDK